MLANDVIYHNTIIRTLWTVLHYWAQVINILLELKGKFDNIVQFGGEGGGGGGGGYTQFSFQRFGERVEGYGPRF